MTFQQTEYKEKSRKLVSLVNQLRDAGAQFQLELPCMVVCGNQSAGKSSLLERLCGVKLPRAAGTCTKCPTEVRLSTAAPADKSMTWCCHVKLRREYSKDNKQLENKPKEQAFKTLNQNQKEQLHFYISAAQRALLNPDTPCDVFVKYADVAAAEAAKVNDSSSSRDSRGGSPDQDLARAPSGVAAAGAVAADDALQFTRNVIVLEITGADVDLSLIDLPGIIQTEQQDDSSNVELVQETVKHYIASKRAIIVATITCKDDIDNQLIVRLAREADKEGHRTIGVLTKADTIEKGTHHTWLPVLQGTTYPLRLGYYCVVNPSQDDLNNNMSAQQAADKEADFFAIDPFFTSDDLLSVRDRFGVDALRVQLSKQLVALTQRELPDMKCALDKIFAEVDRQLQLLPPPPSSDHSLELFRRLRDLSASVQDAIQGEQDITFFRAADSCYSAFRKAVLAARPAVKLGEKARAPAAPGASLATASGYSSAKQLGEEDDEFWLGEQALAVEQESDTEATGDEDADSVITLERVQQLAQQYRSTELPTFNPYRVLEVLVQGLKGKWDAAAQDCLHAVAEELRALTAKLVKQHFGQFATAQMHVSDLLYEVQETLVEDTRQRISELMAMEKEHTWTQNDHYFEDSKEKFKNMLTKRVCGVPAPIQIPADIATPAFGQVTITQALNTLAAAGISLTQADLQELQLLKAKKQASQYDEGLLDLIAGALAYFKVSSKRVIDGVPLHLKHFLLQRYSRELDELLAKRAAAQSANMEASRSSDDSNDSSMAVHNQHTGSINAKAQQMPSAEQLMSEDASITQKRMQRKRQLEQLHDVRRILEKF